MRVLYKVYAKALPGRISLWNPYLSIKPRSHIIETDRLNGHMVLFLYMNARTLRQLSSLRPAPHNDIKYLSERRQNSFTFNVPRYSMS